MSRCPEEYSPPYTSLQEAGQNSMLHHVPQQYTPWSELTQYFTVFRIRMDPGFFADPDPDFKNPDPSVFCFNLLMKYK